MLKREKIQRIGKNNPNSRKQYSHYLNDLVNFQKISGKMKPETKLKVTKNQGHNLIQKNNRGKGQIDLLTF